MTPSRWLAIACSAAVTILWSISAQASADVPVDLIVTNVSGTSAAFSWTGTAPAFRAVIKAGSLPASPADGTVVFDGLAEAVPPNTATATGLSVNTRYFIAVYGKDAGANYSASAVSTSIITTPTRQVLTDGGAPPWDRRGSPTRNGKFIYTTNGGDLDLFNGTTVQPIQPKGAFGNDPNTVFALGSAAAPAQLIAGWRRGTDDAYLSIDGASPIVISATNPVNPGVAMNCEFITIDQGYVFAVFRAPVGASEVRNAFAINPTTGVATNISNNTTTYGVIHMSSSGNKAAWAYDDGTAALKLQYYNGVTATTIDSNILGDPSIAQGRIVYAKYVSPTRTEIFHYDTNLASPTPAQLTNDATKTNDSPFTDGRHAAWIRRLAAGTGPEVVLNGQVQLSNANFALLDNTADPPFQLDRGQIAWRDTTGAIHHVTSFSDSIVDPAASASRAIPWLADGNIVFYDLTSPPVAIYLYQGDTPGDDLRAPMTLKATSSGTSVTLKWDAILGATSYNIYYAAQPGVTKDEYVFLAGGTRLTGIVSTTQTVNSLTANSPYYFVVTAVDASGEGPESREASAVLIGTPSWTSVSGVPGVEVGSVAADRSVANTLYAGAGNFPGPYSTYISTDTGATWTALAGGPAGDVRAIAADNGRVFASTRSGPVYRSLNSGGTWTNLLPTATSGQFTQSVAIDPSEPDTIVIGDITLTTFTGSGNDSYVIRSDDGGGTWFHTPQSASLGGSITTYTLAFDPTHTSTLYVSGNGTPNAAKSIAGGAGWSDLSPAVGYVYAIAVDPKDSKILYAGFQQPSGSRGVWKSTNGGTSWTHTTLTAAAVRALIVDPADSNVIHAGTELGYYYSIDAGATWTLLNTGLPTVDSRFIQTLAMAGNHRLLAGTYSGIYRLDLASLFAEIPTPATTTATATSPTQVTVNWSSVAAATSYDVYRRGDSTGYAKITTVTGLSYPDNSVLADHAYLYRIVAVNATARSGGSPADLATTIMFNSDPLSVNSTPIKFLHLDELRRGTNAVRVLAGLPAYTFTTSGAIGSPVKANQLTEIRTAIDPALNGIRRPSGGYTDVLGSAMQVKAVHVQQIRDRLK